MTTVVARRPMTVAGKHLDAGDDIDVAALPPLRLRQLIEHGWAYETGEGRTMSVSDSTPTGKHAGNGLACDTCGKVLKSPQGVRLHQYRVHNSGKRA